LNETPARSLLIAVLLIKRVADLKKDP